MFIDGENPLVNLKLYLIVYYIFFQIIEAVAVPPVTSRQGVPPATHEPQQSRATNRPKMRDFLNVEETSVGVLQV